MNKLNVLVKQLCTTINDSKLQYIATSMAYTMVLSVVPFVALCISVSKSFGLLDSFKDRVLPLFLSYLTVGAGENLIESLNSGINSINSGALGSFSLVTLVFIATKLLYDVDLAIQHVWGITKRRSALKRLLFYWLTILIGPLVLALLLALTTSGLFTFLNSLPVALITFLSIFTVLYFIYKYVPNTQVKWTAATIPAALAGVTLTIMQKFYAWAAINLLYYSKIYGSLTSIFLFLIWNLILWFIILFGVAVSASLQKGRLKAQA